MKIFGRTKAMRKQFYMGALITAGILAVKTDWYVKLVDMLPKGGQS